MVAPIHKAIDGRALANFILDNYDAFEFEITNLKINKVLYFVHGFSALKTLNPLIRNHFEAWQHGPVVRVVYDAFKCFGDAIITTRATYLDHRSGKNEIVGYEALSTADRDLVRQVSSHYLKYGASELRALTHKPGGAWHRAWHSDVALLRSRIPIEWTREEFEELFGPHRSRAH